MLDFISNYFSDDPILSKLNIRHQPTIVSYFLLEKGFIVFLNSTDYNEKYLKKYGKNGVLLLPESITSKQLVSLKKLINDLSDYDILVNTDLKIVDGFLESKTLANVDHDNDKLIEVITNNYANNFNKSK